MMVIERAMIPETALPVEAFKMHLRLGSGFAEVDLQAPVLSAFLRAAMVAIEARTGKMLLRRAVTVTLSDWTDAARQVLPVAPVRAVAAVELRDDMDSPAALAPSRYRLVRDAVAPALVAAGGGFPGVPEGGSVVISLEAGFADVFAEIPEDLAQAVLLLAAHYYEYRDDTALTEGCMPFGVSSLIAPHRALRLGGAA